MHASVEMISPSMAKEYLERSLPNRPLSESTVARYANDMANGLWINNGQTIVFSESGQLIDGQHRLHAIIKADRSCAMLVARNVPQQAFITMDSGKIRRLSDVLAIEGFKNRLGLAAASRLAWNYIAGVSLGYTPSRGQLEQFVKRHPYLSEMTDRVYNINTRLPKSQLAAVMFLANESKRLSKEVDEFLEGITYGEKLWRGDARLTFREWFNKVHLGEKSNKGENASMTLFGAVARAWNAFGSGRELLVLRNIYGASRENLDVHGFDLAYYGDVPDIAVQAREQQLEILGSQRDKRIGQAAHAREVQAAQRAGHSGG